MGKQGDPCLDLDVGLATNGNLPTTNGKAAQKMKKSASESALSLKLGKRDSPGSPWAEKSTEITYEWVRDT